MGPATPLLLVALSVAAAVAAVSGARTPVPAIYVFGDSTADVGNNDYLPGSNAKANFPHNGVDFPGAAPTGRFSNGYNGIDFLAINLGFSRSPPPYLSLTANNSSQMSKILAGYTGVNFASGGSGLLDSTGTTITMTKQLEYFSALKEQISTRLSADRVSLLLSKSIFLISTGGNDAFAFFSQQKSLNATAVELFRETMISTYESHLKALYNLGARKFAIIDVPLLGCCPYSRSLNPTGECIEPLNQLAKNLNDGIGALFSNLSSELQGMNYSIASSYELVSSLIANPQVAGFAEVKSACCGGGKFNAEEGCTPNSTYCGDRSKYLFWDFLHPTQATSRFAGVQFYDGPVRFVGPISYKQLVEA